MHHLKKRQKTAFSEDVIADHLLSSLGCSDTSKSPGMIVTAGTLNTPVVSSGYYYPGIIVSVLVRIRLCLVFSCFSFTGTEF